MNFDFNFDFNFNFNFNFDYDFDYDFNFDLVLFFVFFFSYLILVFRKPHSKSFSPAIVSRQTYSTNYSPTSMCVQNEMVFIETIELC